MMLDQSLSQAYEIVNTTHNEVSSDLYVKYNLEGCFLFDNFNSKKDNNGNPFTSQTDLSDVKKTMAVSEKIDFNNKNNDYFPSQFTRTHWISHKSTEKSTSILIGENNNGIRNTTDIVYRPSLSTNDSGIMTGNKPDYQKHTDNIDDPLETLPIHPSIEVSFSQKIEKEPQTNTRTMSVFSDTSDSETNGVFKGRIYGMQALELFSRNSDFKVTEDLHARISSPRILFDFDDIAGTLICENLTKETCDMTENEPKNHSSDECRSNHDSNLLDGIVIPSMKRCMTLKAKSRLSQSRVQEWDK